MKKQYWFIIILILILIGISVWRFSTPEDSWVCENGTWVRHGQPADPAPVTGCGDEPVALPEDLQIFSPQANEVITSPLTITGQARGGWYFEAVFPVQITTVHGLVLGNTSARAESDWMTNDFVPFSATLDFVLPTDVDQGEIIFEKANPSGLPEHGAEYRLPIKFKID